MNYTWISRDNQGGKEALIIGARGRSGEDRKLAATQESKLKELLVGKSLE